jgi:hypothetical protein
LAKPQLIGKTFLISWQKFYFLKIKLLHIFGQTSIFWQNLSISWQKLYLFLTSLLYIFGQNLYIFFTKPLSLLD